MVRNRLGAVVGAGLLLALALASAPAAGEDTEAKLRAQLAVQTALQQGRDNLQRGDYQAAVYCLEKEIARVDGNRDYMNALREAYRGYIRELHQADRSAEARTYQERLKILDPGYQLELHPARTSAAPALAALASQTATPAPARKPESPAAAYTARPQAPEEPDPFADGNSAQPERVPDLLDRARHEFEQHNYAAANRLFERANRIDGGALAPARDLWAYCKLYAVVDVLNRTGAPAPAEAEKEVLAALALTTSPKLEGFGKDLLRKLRDRQLTVRHTPAHDQNWAEAETANFIVVHNQSRDLAEQVARTAEETRAAVIRRWFGEEPAPWPQKCRIILYATGELYARDTHQPATSPGHSTIKADPANLERVLLRRIDLHCDVPEMLTHVLPHETTHAVLAGRFGPHLVPRWADEGMAVLSEPRDKIDRYLRGLPAYRSKNELFSLSQLMSLKDYPEARRVSPFYVQSISLVEFLASQKGGPPTFARFLRDGLSSGYEAALRQHYDIQDFNDLETRWSQAASGAPTRTAAMYGPR